MAIAISFSDADLKRGEVIEPGWYTVNIEKVDESLAKNQQSTNYRLTGTILRNGDNGDEKYAGYPIPYWNFNSKAPGFMQPFFKAILGLDKLEAGQAYDLKYAEGKTIDINIVNNLDDQGVMRCQVGNQFRQPRS